MNSRLLNVILVFALVVITLQLFTTKPVDPMESLAPGVYLRSDTPEYIMPTPPTFHIVDHTSAPVTIDTCRDIAISRDSARVDHLPTEFCRTMTLSGGTETGFSLMPIHRLFETVGQYTFTLSGSSMATGSGVTVSMTQPWVLRSFFRTVFYAPIYNLFVGIVSFLPDHSLGLAIILLTVVIRIILLFPQHHMLVNSRKMQAIQPHVRAIQEEHAGDQTKIGTALLELYKREKVNPLGSCLPLFLQMPILIVLYWVVRDITDTSNYYFLYSFFSGFDISMINTHFLGIDLMSIGGRDAIILCVIVWIVQFIQVRLSLPSVPPTPPTPTKKPADGHEDAPSLTPDPAMMNQFMLWGFPLMLAVTTFFFPLGIAVYWIVGTIFMIGQQAVVNRLHPRP